MESTDTELKKFLHLKDELASVTSRLIFINKELRSLLSDRMSRANKVNIPTNQPVNLEALPNNVKESAQDMDGVVRLFPRGRRPHVHLVHDKSSPPGEDSEDK